MSLKRIFHRYSTQITHLFMQLHKNIFLFLIDILCTFKVRNLGGLPPSVIQNLNEMVIENLKIERVLLPKNFNTVAGQLDTATANSNGDILASLQDCLPSLNGSSSSSPFGRVIAVAIKGFGLKSLTKSGQILLDCRAKNGEINNKNAQLKLADVVLRSPDSKRVISAKKGIWNPDKQRFEIKGEYQATSPRGSARGRGISVDLYYHLEAL